MDEIESMTNIAGKLAASAISVGKTMDETTAKQIAVFTLDIRDALLDEHMDRLPENVARESLKTLENES